MAITVLDVETTVDFESNNSPSPWCDNSLVYIGYRHKGVTGGVRVGPHLSRKDIKAIQNMLDDTTLLVGHNIGFDLVWLWETGFKYDGEVWDTMLFEYNMELGKGAPMPSLVYCCEKYGIPTKTLNLKDYFAQKVNTDEINPDLLEEYCLNDILITAKLYIKQTELLHNNVHSIFGRKNAVRG